VCCGADIKEAFNVFDENHDGKITADELERVIRRLGMRPTDTDLRQMIEEVDSDSEYTCTLLLVH
jgi:calmodulin